MTNKSISILKFQIDYFELLMIINRHVRPVSFYPRVVIEILKLKRFLYHFLGGTHRSVQFIHA